MSIADLLFSKFTPMHAVFRHLYESAKAWLNIYTVVRKIHCLDRFCGESLVSMYVISDSYSMHSLTVVLVYLKLYNKELL